MKKLSSFPKSFLSLTLVLAILLTAAAPALGAETVSDAASAIQLMKTEGSVSITNGSGRALSVRENMRLYNGYHAKTTEKSYAWVNLDSSKLIKLDEVSEAEVRKAGKKLEVLLNSGNLYFDVSEPLDQEENLNIRTSTMIVGIRGTCGWVKMLNAWHAQVYLLEGRVECSVTDPATGESRTTVLQGGEMAEFVVYPQGQTGERCDIIRQSYAEEHIDGFVLVELVKDRTLCEKIYADSSLDVLGHFDQSSAQKQLERDQAAMAETLREMEQALSTQDNRVSQDPVWDSGGSRDDSSSDSGSSSTPGGGDSGVTSEPATVALTMPVTDMDVQQALNRPATQRVVVAPGTNAAQNTLEIGINMTVDSGKTLTLDSGVPARVQGSLTVNGTADLGDSLTNDGTITVNSANTLRVAGRFVNSAGGTITNTASGRITVRLGLSNAGSLSTAGRIEGPVSLTGGSFTITGGEVTSDQTATLSVSSGAALALTGGAVTNTGSGTAVTLAAGLSFPAGFATDFRAKTAVVASPFPSGCGAALQSDGYYHLAETVTAGAFAVNGGEEGVDYTYDGSSGKFSVISPTPLTISMAEGVDQTTTDSIFVEDGVSANVTLAGVNIDLSATGEYSSGGGTGTPGVPAFQIADNSSGNVSITLSAGTENVLLSGAGRAGLEKNSKESSGRLTIKGTGKLTATGGDIYMNPTPDISHSGAGIGACGFPNNGNSICANITIEGGEISASSSSSYAPGIGDEIGAVGIQIAGGTVTVPGTLGILSADITISGGTVNGDISTSSFDMSAGTVNGKVVNVSERFTISGGTVNGSVTLMSGSNTTGQLTISGGEIVCSKNGSAVSVNAPAQMSFTGGTVTQIIEGTALRLYNSGGSDILTFPADCATVFRSTHSRVIDPLPDGWGVEQRNDGYYYLTPWSTATLSSDGLTAEAIQAALADSDEVYISGSSPVSLAGNLTIPAGKAVTLEGGTKLSIGESGVSAPTVTVNGRLDASECTNFDHSGFLRIGPEGTFLAAINFVNRGVIENDGTIVFPYTRSTVMLNGGEYSSVGEPCRVTNRGTIDFGGTDPSSSGILENSGTITGITRLILSGKTDITGGTITANSTGSVLELHYGASVTISGGTITQESASGHAIGWSGGTDGTLSVTGGEVRAKAPSLLWYNADVTDEKGYQALEMADGYYYLVKKEENP